MSNAVCSIVGAGPGVGQAVARRFALAGFQIALVARRPAVLEQQATELQASGATAQTFPADATDPAALQAAFQQIHAQMGAPAVLVYNAAVIRDGMPSDTAYENLINDFRVNVAGALVCVQAVLPTMREQQRGTILFTGGGLALDPYAQYASLAIGKAGLRSLTYTLGAELEPQGIHVATVTIAGTVQPGTFFAPDLIAEQYWNLHTQAPGTWQREIVYR
ncbi:MAG: SDR family NAD(P)-dependent oxidoreductase [Chloroflexaceae bacterium]|nr:SDR family NAD(P)-dependent oxidoreductase [Chloroflexaceae bacterium]NJO06953.1 SDR family NAD(P)-dependent oxidoreductase [Chloroflexaceae bacterium]